MFSSPTRTKVLKEDGYSLPLVVPVQLDIKVKAENGKIITALRHQPAFDALRHRVLEELPKNKQMFKTVPSYASLDSITPPWGFVSTSEGILLSPYAQISSNLDTDFTGDVTFTLVAVLISRSSVIPHFQIDAMKNVIELAWGEDNDLAEVSDIPSVEGGSELRLVDPAVREKEKQEEKERIRELFREAQELAETWYEKYEPSDTESTFTEWMGEDET
jgi:hypothetical protein